MKRATQNFLISQFNIDDFKIFLDCDISENRNYTWITIEKIVDTKAPHIGIEEIKRFTKIPNVIEMIIKLQNGMIIKSGNKDFLYHYNGADKETWNLCISRGKI